MLQQYQSVLEVFCVFTEEKYVVKCQSGVTPRVCWLVCTGYAGQLRGGAGRSQCLIENCDEPGQVISGPQTMSLCLSLFLIEGSQRVSSVPVFSATKQV